MWVNGGVLAEEELSTLRAGGMNVTNFYDAFDIHDPEQIKEAVATIELHHPGSVVWVEHVSLTTTG